MLSKNFTTPLSLNVCKGLTTHNLIPTNVSKGPYGLTAGTQAITWIILPSWPWRKRDAVVNSHRLRPDHHFPDQQSNNPLFLFNIKDLSRFLEFLHKFFHGNIYL